MVEAAKKVALITGDSRGIGALPQDYSPKRAMHCA